jgi:WSC domain
MRSAALRFGASFFLLAFSSVAASAQTPGLSPGSLEETAPQDLDGDGIPQNFELRLAQHFFPTIWYDVGEDTSAPGGNHDHRERNQPGRLLFRVRPHPQEPNRIAITYALLYRIDGGEGFGVTGPCHKGDVEPFAITLKPDPSCPLGYRMESIKAWAHVGAPGFHENARYPDGCNWGFSAGAVSFSDVIFVSENKHGNYLTDGECDAGLWGAENCDTDWTAGDVNAWTGLNVGERAAPRHDDLSLLGFPYDRTWTGQNFCGFPHSPADLDDLNDCAWQQDCPAAAETKFTDQFVAPFIPGPYPPPTPASLGCFTDDHDRALPYGLGNVDDVAACVNLARANGLAYAGLQWYGQCWGGNELRYTQVAAGECNTPCPSGQICGGAWRNTIYATGNTPPPPPPGGMQADSAVRGCSNWSWWSPVYQPDAGACSNHCAQNGADACEWNVNGDCYVEFASGGCFVQGGFPGWSAAVF